MMMVIKFLDPIVYCVVCGIIPKLGACSVNKKAHLFVEYVEISVRKTTCSSCLQIY